MKKLLNFVVKNPMWYIQYVLVTMVMLELVGVLHVQYMTYLISTITFQIDTFQLCMITLSASFIDNFPLLFIIIIDNFPLLLP